MPRKRILSRYQMNTVKMNELGFPVFPDQAPMSEKSPVKVSNYQSNTRLKGFKEDPTIFGRSHKYRGIIEKYFGVPYKVLRISLMILL